MNAEPSRSIRRTNVCDLQLGFKPRGREGLEKRLCGPTGSPVDDRLAKCPQQATMRRADRTHVRQVRALERTLGTA